MPVLRSFAPARLNLYLHVTACRPDGAYELDSLVAFCDVGDEVTLTPSPDGFAFALEGPMALALLQQRPENNMVARAAKTLAEALDKPLDIKLTLAKNLPITSGLGGGANDAAATLRLLARYWGLAADAPVLFDVGRMLGQDIPCSINRETCYFGGVGEILDPGPELPPTHIVLANPGRSLPPHSVFNTRQGDFSLPDHLPKTPTDTADLAAMLRERRNDLTQASCGIAPEIKNALLALETSPNCLLARMSGAGATCFGLYPDRASARMAASKIFSAHPSWWVVPAFFPKKKTASADLEQMNLNRRAS